MGQESREVISDVLTLRLALERLPIKPFRRGDVSLLPHEICEVSQGVDMVAIEFKCSPVRTLRAGAVASLVLQESAVVRMGVRIVRLFAKLNLVVFVGSF